MKLIEIIKVLLPESTVYILMNLRTFFRKRKPIKYIEKEINRKYYSIFKTNINWENPLTYSEKLNVTKLYGVEKIKTRLTDKLLVRDWVEKVIGKEYLIPILGVYDNYSDIDFEKLPKSFVIKCNHDSGSVTICNDKSKISFKRLKKKYNFYLKRNYAYNNYEMHYKYIKPKIMIEENMGANIMDYKFLCFDGKPYYCWVDSDRFVNHKRNIYDMEWNLQPFNQMNYENAENISKPKSFSKMVEIATELSTGFDHVRVDLYEIEGKIYFGEMTFTNGSGFETIHPKEYDVLLGSYWNFDNSKRKNFKVRK